MKNENISLEAFKEIWLSDNAAFLQSFVDNSAFFKTNYKFCYENFVPQLGSKKVDQDGVASFTIKTKVNTPDGMADYKAPLGRNTGIDFIGSAGYTGSLATFGKALPPVNALQRREWNDIVNQFGSASPIVIDWMPKIQTLKNYIDSRMSEMAGSLLSKGKIEGRNSTTGALLYLQNALVPDANYVNAGKLAWTDPNCDLLDQMRIIETEYRYRTADEQPLEWMIKLQMWRDIFMTNTKLKAKVTEWRTVRELPTSSGGEILESWLVDYINTLGLTSPIRIAKEGEIAQDILNKGYNDTRKDVEGWESNIAILKPRGYAGEIVKGEIIKASLMLQEESKTVRSMVAYLDGGISALITSVVEDKNGWGTYHTDLEACAAPALTCAPFLTIVDTSTAD